MIYEQAAGVKFMYQAADEYSFVDNYGETMHLYYITVATTGDSVDYERKVSIAVVENDTNYVNTARPEQYKLLEGVVPAGAFSGEMCIRDRKRSCGNRCKPLKMRIGCWIKRTGTRNLSVVSTPRRGKLPVLPV